MTKQSVGNSPAFGSDSHLGLTKREYLATHIMAGLASNADITDSKMAAMMAVDAANFLITILCADDCSGQEESSEQT